MSSPMKVDAIDGPSHVHTEGSTPCCPGMPATSGRLLPATRLTLPEFLEVEQGVTAGAPNSSHRALDLGDENETAVFRNSSSGSEIDEDRNVFDRDQESVTGKDNGDDVWMAFNKGECLIDEESARFGMEVGRELKNKDERISVEEDVIDERKARVGHTVSMGFCWSEDFTSFTGQKETYTRVPGPPFISYIPTDIFCQIWTREFMEIVAKETNKYARQLISQICDPDSGLSIPKCLNAWTETTVEELYRYFAITIYMSHCQRPKIQDYWYNGVMGMPGFRDIMSQNRFLLLTKFLHFENNENLLSSEYDRKIAKVKPVVDHCNKKFAELYTPSQHLSINESLPLWRGLRSKAAHAVIKSFELCEWRTGYLLQYRLYTDKGTAMHPGPLHGFNDYKAKIVLQLMERYLDAGHTLFMDNWYNQLPLTRYLKSRRTDILGTVNRRRLDIPPAIKDLEAKDLKDGESVARHSGDITLVAWRGVKLATVMSTYHRHEMVPVKHEGQVHSIPVAVQDYHRYMGGVHPKEQELAMYMFQHKRNQKWYMKVFRWLFNTSLLNAYIMYKRNPLDSMYSHRQFRLKVAEGLLSRNLCVSPMPSSVPNITQRPARLNPGDHFPIHVEEADEPRKHKKLRCVRCAAKKKRVLVIYMCKTCQVALCIGQCWKDYHTLENL